MKKYFYNCQVKLVREQRIDYDCEHITSVNDAYNAAITMGFQDYAEERFGVFMLDSKGQINGYIEVSKGDLSSTAVHPREVFKAAILANSAAIICTHNHPSSNPEPSREDIRMTKKLQKCGELLSIPLLDHIIIGYPQGCYYSMREEHELD